VIAYLTGLDINTHNRPLMFAKYLNAKIYQIRTLFGYFINPNKVKIKKENYISSSSPKRTTSLLRKLNPKFGCQRLSGEYIIRSLFMEIGIGLFTKRFHEDVIISLNSIGTYGEKVLNKRKRIVVDLMDLPTCSHAFKIAEVDYHALKKADAVFVWSKAIEIYLRRLGIKTFYLPYGLDLEIFDPIKIGGKIFFENYPQAEGKIVIGYSGSMWFRDGRDVLGVEKILKAYKIVEETYKDDVILVVQTSDKVLEIINNLKIKNYVYVKPTKAWYDPLRQSLFSSIDVFVAPATRYPPVYLAERSTYFQAMSRGKPIVVERTPGSAGLFRDGETALMARLDDVNDLAAKIALLIEDKNLARRIGTNARRVLEEKYTWSVLAKRAYDIIESL